MNRTDYETVVGHLGMAKSFLRDAQTITPKETCINLSIMYIEEALKELFWKQNGPGVSA